MKPAGAKGERWERRDLNSKGVVIFAASFIACAIVIHVVVAFQLRALEHGKEGRIAAETPPVSWVGVPLPHLEVAGNPGPAKQDLNGYGWVDQSRGIARIPVERAMEIYASQHSTHEKP